MKKNLVGEKLKPLVFFTIPLSYGKAIKIIVG